MLGSLKVFLLLYICHIIVESAIPGLSVRKLDRKLIARKRQDTLDMCRMFNEESEKMKYSEPNNLNQDNQNSHIIKKRDVGNQVFSINPALNEEDEKRVEKIVDKLYEDVEDKGERVTYRRPRVPSTTETHTPSKNISSRRFHFAPKLLLGPQPKEQEPHKADDSPYDQPRARFPRGIVPYYIDSQTYDADLAEVIMKAFDYFEKATCIRLQKLRVRPTDRQSLYNVAWVYITNPSGVRQCVHSNERRRTKGVLMVVFGYDCMSLGDIVHEVMHVLGFSHEHIRSDRDQHISIMWDNIKPGYKKYFDIQEGEYQSLVETLPYDYTSVLHYPPRAFSKNGQVTIHTEPGIKIGQREGLSELDVEKIGLVYSNECRKRNRDYLLKTCPSVVKSDTRLKNITSKEIEDYFRPRLWPFGIINYKLRDAMEFSVEERENIKAVVRHIEKETCLQFKDLSTNDVDSDPELEFHTDVEEDETGTPKGDTGNSSKKPKEQTSTTVADLNKTSAENEVLNKVSESEKKPEGDDDKMAENVPLKNESKDKEKENRRRNLRKSKKQRRQNSPVPSRKHANNILVLARSPKPGCICPRPGRPNGYKLLEINSDCFNSVNDLLHLFVHVLGLDHQHNMHDRDSYLHIIWQRLTPDVREEMKEKLPPAASVGFPYDYQSVMHYPWLQIKNGVTNIMYPIWNDGWAMGHWQGLSSTDVQKLNLLYFNECVNRTKQEEASRF